MNNPIHITRFFRADRLRKQQRGLLEIRVKPSTKALNDKQFDRDDAVFWTLAVLAVVTFWLSVLGLIWP